MAAITLACSSSALAQVNPEGGDMAPAQPPGTWQPPTNQMPPPQPMMPQPMPATDPASEPEASEDQGASGDDHAAVVGRFGVGFFGVTTLPFVICVGGDPACPMIVQPPDDVIDVPTIGARYWLSDVLGIEAALGLNISSSSSGVLESSRFGLALHGGVPLALAYGGHFVFEVVPQVNFGISSGSFDNTMLNTTASVSGLMIELGARVGAEIHFGFIDLPDLSLQGTLGLSLRNESRSIEAMAVATGPTSTLEQSSLTIGTNVQGEPWDIFTGAIAAIYYF